MKETTREAFHVSLDIGFISDVKHPEHKPTYSTTVINDSIQILDLQHQSGANSFC